MRKYLLLGGVLFGCNFVSAYVFQTFNLNYVTASNQILESMNVVVEPTSFVSASIGSWSQENIVQVDSVNNGSIQFLINQGYGVNLSSSGWGYATHTGWFLNQNIANSTIQNLPQCLPMTRGWSCPGLKPQFLAIVNLNFTLNNTPYECSNVPLGVAGNIINYIVYSYTKYYGVIFTNNIGVGRNLSQPNQYNYAVGSFPSYAASISCLNANTQESEVFSIFSNYGSNTFNFGITKDQL
jgi:hypothetical protein